MALAFCLEPTRATSPLSATTLTLQGDAPELQGAPHRFTQTEHDQQSLGTPSPVKMFCRSFSRTDMGTEEILSLSPRRTGTRLHTGTLPGARA